MNKSLKKDLKKKTLLNCIWSIRLLDMKFKKQYSVFLTILQYLNFEMVLK